MAGSGYTSCPCCGWDTISDDMDAPELCGDCEAGECPNSNAAACLGIPPLVTYAPHVEVPGGHDPGDEDDGFDDEPTVVFLKANFGPTTEDPPWMRQGGEPVDDWDHWTSPT